MGSNKGKEVVSYLNAGGCGSGNPWCAAFISWSYKQAYNSNSAAYGKKTLPKTCGALDLISFFGSHGHHKYSISKVKPEKGDVVYKTRSGGSGHVGIVVARKGSTIYVVEGNHSDMAAFAKYDNYGRDHWSKVGKW